MGAAARSRPARCARTTETVNGWRTLWRGPKVRLDKYRKVFAVRGFPLVMALGLLAKLPIVAIPIILTLHVATGLDRGYGQAGLVIGAWTAGVTVGAPILGRFIQRYGLRPVLAVVTL